MANIFESTRNALTETASSLQELNSKISRNTEKLTGQTLSTRVRQGGVTNQKMIIWQVKGISEQLEIPDLAMKINPKNLDSKYTQLINRKRTLGGFIEEHWGEQLDTLSASGTSGTFFSDFGLTNLNRRDTTAYRDLEQLINIYRNNGSVYDHKTGSIVAQGTVIMNYDGSVFHGYFENFSINEMAEKQFELFYDFTFKVTYEEFPGRKTSFKNITMVSGLSEQKIDNVTLSILD